MPMKHHITLDQEDIEEAIRKHAGLKADATLEFEAKLSGRKITRLIAVVSGEKADEVTAEDAVTESVVSTKG